LQTAEREGHPDRARQWQVERDVGRARLGAAAELILVSPRIDGRPMIEGASSSRDGNLAHQAQLLGAIAVRARESSVINAGP
jgi:hypothetical protein